MMSVGYLAVCWGAKCLTRVPQDPDHIGLCDRCRDALRDPDRRAPE